MREEKNAEEGVVLVLALCGILVGEIGRAISESCTVKGGDGSKVSLPRFQ